MLTLNTDTYERLVRPLLFALPPESAQAAADFVLKRVGLWKMLSPVLRAPAGGSVTLAGLELADGEPVAVLNPGAGWVTKRWEPARMGELGRRLIGEDGYRVVAAWAGPDEEAMARTIIETAGPGAHLAPPTTLRELAALLARARLFVGCDTGPMHMAAALNVPTVALFGAADHRRNGPYGPHGRAVTAGVECSPCWLAEGCPHDLRCMTEITVEQVLDAARQLTGRRPAVERC